MLCWALAAEKNTSGSATRPSAPLMSTAQPACGNKVLARRLATKRKHQLRRDETAWYSRIADEAEDAKRTGNCAVLYRTIRTLTGRTASELPPVTAKDGSSLCDETDQLHRWKDHFQELFNNPAPPLDPFLMAEAASATPDPSVDSTPPTADEISTAIRKLKKTRASGICGITAELLKSEWSPRHQLATSSLHTHLEVLCYPY